jgi:hypothetical protein
MMSGRMPILGVLLAGVVVVINNMVNGLLSVIPFRGFHDLEKIGLLIKNHHQDSLTTTGRIFLIRY